jgi:predicted TIM-barrel fold metal-dependent hydrolase
MAVIDVDSHVYEPPEIWDRVPTEYQSLARAAFYHEVDRDGNRLTILNGAPGRELNRSRLVRQAIWHPGMTVEQIGDLDPDMFHPLNPGASDVTARLEDMDAMGIGAAVVFPTLFSEYLPLVQNPDAAAILARAYNDWIWDFAQQANGRLHPVALLPLNSVLLAQRELARVVEKGFTSVCIRPAFYQMQRVVEHTPLAQRQEMMRRVLLAGGTGGSTLEIDRVYVEDRPFRPLWGQIEELRVTACVHPSLGITGPDSVSSGAFADRVSRRLGANHSVAEPIAYTQDADLFMTAAFFHGLLEDHPNLRLAILHSGATWVPLALEKCETYLWLVPQFGQADVCLEPEEVWRRHPVLVSFDGWERAVGRMPDRIGDKAAWGSRYPAHDSSTAVEARTMLESEGVDASTIERLLGGYAGDFFRMVMPADF